MRIILILYCFLYFNNSLAQLAPPVLQWQKSYGGSLNDNAVDMVLLADGSIVVLATSFSNDGDITGNHPTPPPFITSDIAVLKFDQSGNLLWQKMYGGSLQDIGNSIISTNDGGFAFVGRTRSFDGDVSNNNGDEDIWIVKLDGAGNILWENTYGGSAQEMGSDIIELNNGFMVIGSTKSTDGDVSGFFGISDVWILRLDVSGHIIWKRVYGGSLADGNSGMERIAIAPDGYFIFTSTINSIDGDISDPLTTLQDLWIVKISGNGNILWDKRYGGEFGEYIHDLIVNLDETLFITGKTYSKTLPGAYPGEARGSAWALKIDPGGNLIWMKILGGSEEDVASSAIATTDGGYLLAGETASDDGEVCKRFLLRDLWLIKLNADGIVQWSRTFGGNKEDIGKKIILTPAGDCLVLSSTNSSDGELTLNKGLNDLWLTKFNFTGALRYCSVSIHSDTDSIPCSGPTVYFVATPVEGGTQPSFQWKINGNNTGTNNDTLYLNSMQSNDVITCVMTSNSNCVEIKTALSNSLSVKVGNVSIPGNFLPRDTSLCSYQEIELKTIKNFKSYLWSSGETSPSITIRNSGIYWLEVTDNNYCKGKDSIIISNLTCPEGIFVPTAFTPNSDGRNDIFKPIMNAFILQYKFTIFDRWGHKVFESTSLNEGWDGKVNGNPYNTGVFIWHCNYQIEGQLPTTKRGTVLVLR